MAVQGRAKSKASVRRFGRQGAAAMAMSSAPGLAAVLKTQSSGPTPAGDPDPDEGLLRYDGLSGRLSPNARAGGAELATKVTSTGAAPLLVVRVAAAKVPSGADLMVSAAVFNQRGRPIQPDSIVAVVAANGALPAPELPMQPAAGGGFELRVPIPERPVTFGWAVRARGEMQGGLFDRVAAGAFRASAAGGRIDATAARVEKRNGDLELTAPAEIHVPGTYWVYAELWGGPGGTRPIAFARRRFEDLGTGSRALSLSFGGAIIRHSRIDGPYLMRNLRIQQNDGCDSGSEEEEPIPCLPPTAAYRAEEFDADAFGRDLRFVPPRRSRGAAFRRHR